MADKEEIEIDEHAKRLSVEQKIRAPYLDREGKPDPADLRRQVKEHSHCFVDFEARPGKGVTSLNSEIKPENQTFTDDDRFKFVGEPLKLNGTPIRVHADIDLSTMQGTGRCEILADAP
eukprot:TRINITY_DN15174_c0_g2_i1.p1 TRINITY_DN15174_c0_g2~~TRINITY_DN15174_c0_g2_i1.p1  ORF type:complete len:119 (+),score=49.17 TRINITY_DN15174_c0_g2_i1:83-439(+)